MSEKNPTAKPFTVRIYDDDIERFNHIAAEMDVETNGGAFRKLLDFYQNPPERIIRDNPVLVQRNAELEAEIEAKADEITELRSHLDQLQRDYNESGETGTQLQLEIDRLKAENAALKDKNNLPENYVGGTLPPVPLYFLHKMAKLQSQKDKQERTPFYILATNFIQDLQNPLSNHLPMIVSSDELRKAQEEYKKSLKTEQKEEE